jgi:hypothetical protein
MSVGFEISLAIVAFTVAALEADQSFTNNKPAYMDWLLISWAIHSFTDQKKTIAVLFKRHGPETSVENPAYENRDKEARNQKMLSLIRRAL